VRVGRLFLGLVVICRAASWTGALETDQYYSWNRPLEDATDAINAEVNSGIEEVLERVNARRRPCPCNEIVRAIDARFDYLIIARIELWAMKTPLVERVPASGDDEPAYRRDWLYGGSSPLDLIHCMPPSPTIEVASVRIGIDKLGHFFSDGEWAYQSYQQVRNGGATDEEAMAHAMRGSLITERTIWGQGISGILSRSDLEADYQGLMFYRGLCDGEEPMLELTSGAWSMRKPFDLRDWVGPGWDESWRSSIFSPSRWAKVKPVIHRYCELLQTPEVQRRRADYAARDRESPMGRLVRELVASGKLADPTPFTIEAVCATPADRPGP
jgi:hypothetical protein